MSLIEVVGVIGTGAFDAGAVVGRILAESPKRAAETIGKMLPVLFWATGDRSYDDQGYNYGSSLACDSFRVRENSDFWYDPKLGELTGYCGIKKLGSVSCAHLVAL